MEIIDLSHAIANEMPAYPGTESPVITQSSSIGENGYAEKMISMTSHTGTHVDAPSHMIQGANTLDQFSLDHFIGEGFIADISTLNKMIIDPEDLGGELERIRDKDFVLFHTGWSQYWGDEKYFREFPALSNRLVNTLTASNLKGIGLDTSSIDPYGTDHFSNHMTVFLRNIIIIENLTNLDKLIGKDFLFICNPLKIDKTDGSPVRAFAITRYSGSGF